MREFVLGLRQGLEVAIGAKDALDAGDYDSARCAIRCDLSGLEAEVTHDDVLLDLAGAFTDHVD